MYILNANSFVVANATDFKFDIHSIKDF